MTIARACSSACARWQGGVRHSRIVAQCSAVPESSNTKAAERSLHQGGPPLLRRSVLHLAALQAVAPLLFTRSHKAQAAGVRSTPPVVNLASLEAVQRHWDTAVREIRLQLGDGFSARLVVYGVPGMELPVGAPGDPGKDFGSSGRGGDGHCGAFQPGANAPYALCPPTGEAPDSDLAATCCRHYAYCVPYGRLSLDRTSTVVVAPRLLRLPPERWQAILAHELGHAVDFYLFGGRYGLRNKPSIVSAATGELRSLLEAANAEPDPEARGDLLGEGLLLRHRGQRLCYDPALRLQLLVDGAAPPCEGDGSGSQLMRHYSHPLIRRRV